MARFCFDVDFSEGADLLNVARKTARRQIAEVEALYGVAWPSMYAEVLTALKADPSLSLLDAAASVAQSHEDQTQDLCKRLDALQRHES